MVGSFFIGIPIIMVKEALIQVGHFYGRHCFHFSCCPHLEFILTIK